jgi:hypothetical protein
MTVHDVHTAPLTGKAPMSHVDLPVLQPTPKSMLAIAPG